jgi:EAL domain-containing protein (putative c-di-GMP-specific phosphodiesterase class I)
MSKRSRVGILGRATGRLSFEGPVNPRKALTAIGCTTLSWDLATDALAWGPNAAELLGIPSPAIYSSGSAFAEAVEAEGGDTRIEAMLRTGEADDGCGVPYRARYGLRLKADRLLLVEETGRWYAGADGRPALARALLRVTPGARGEDSLGAGLKARAALLSQIVDDVLEAQRSRHAVTLIVGACSPDDDGTVAEIGRRIRPLLRRRDRFVPYGPGRFALALASCPAAEAEGAARRILALLAGLPARLGIASAPDHAVDAPQLLHRAEEALALAVADGGPGFTIYDPRLMAQAGSAAGTGLQHLLEALNDRRLVLARSPVLDTRGRGILFHESLPRLREEDGTPSVANDLAALAEREGIPLLVDGRLLELTADHLAAHPRERAALRVAPASLADGEWLVMLAAHLGVRQDIESRLVVDVPETALADEAILGRLDAMKALGVATMVSGFGGGGLSFRHLRNLPVDMVKIDGALVQALPVSVENRHYLRSLIELAHHLGIMVIAEGVDDEATSRLLAAWGADGLQGRAVGTPVMEGTDVAVPRLAALN